MATTEIAGTQAYAPTKKGSIKAQRFVGRAIAIVILTLGGLLVMLPLVWLISGSLKTNDASTAFPPQWIPMDTQKVNIDKKDYFLYWIPYEGKQVEWAMLKKRPGEKAIFMNPADTTQQIELPLADTKKSMVINLHWENYPKALTMVPFLKYLQNTLLVVFTTTVGVLLSCVLVAYGFSRFRAPAMDIFFLLLLSTIMLPAQVTLIPTFIIFQKLGWYDTLLPLIIPAFFANAWDVFLLRQFFMSIPIEMDEAAIIDGASPLGVLFYILIPQAWPALATVAVFHFLWAWNDFYGALIYLQHQDKWTVALGLQSFNALYSRNTVYLMAASTVTMLPCLLLFFIAQKLFIQGVVVSGVKG
jgi:multiple sugar transport system permease protein